MRTFLARCSTLGLLAGGFMLTGDAGWLVDRGTSLLNATTIPLPTADEATAAPSQSGFATAAPAPQPAPAAPLAPAAPAVPSPVETVVHPTLAAPALAPPDDGGLNAIDLRLLKPGDRLLVWVRGTPTAFDLVDPASGEAIEQPGPRRVRIGGTTEQPRLVRGGSVIVQPLAGITGHTPAAEQIGPVQAIAVK